jgi:hypothetical protein
MSEDQLENLSRYLDGDLEESERQQLEALLEQDSELRHQMKELSAADALMRRAINGLAADDVPAHITALVNRSLHEVRLEDQPLARETKWPLALAASTLVLVSFLAGQRLPLTSDLGSSAAMETALNTTLEGSASMHEGWVNLGNDAQIRPTLSFASTAGNWCREYLMRKPGGQWQGVACRIDGNWQVGLLIATEAERATGDGYLPASTNGSEIFSSYTESLGGSPVGAVAENELISSGWR